MNISQRMLQYMEAEKPFLSDGGLETSIIFKDGIDLPEFAAFTLLDSDEGRASLDRYFQKFLKIAQDVGTGFVLDTATWRANSAWGRVMGLGHDEISAVNRAAVDYAVRLRLGWESNQLPILLNGMIGPAGDGYVIDDILSPQKAKDIHAIQINTFAKSGVDMVTAMTMTYAQEAIGVVLAAQAVDMPVVIAFTVETNGRLPSGQTIAEAIEQVDRETGAGPLYYMINCAHPEHFSDVLAKGAGWLTRIGAIRANASRMSHAELDAATSLDEGDPAQLAQDYKSLQKMLPNLKMLGGCCGTDHQHVAAIAQACIVKRDDALL